MEEEDGCGCFDGVPLNDLHIRQGVNSSCKSEKEQRMRGNPCPVKRFCSINYSLGIEVEKIGVA